MDEGTPPTPAELGITEAEYDRIVGDLGRRRLIEPGPAATVPDAWATSPFAPDPGRRVRRRAMLLVAATVVLAVVAVSRPFEDSSSEPAYAFLYEDSGGPVTYSSCRPVPVAVYPAGGPADADALVDEAVGLLRSATGLDIVVTGSFGGAAPNWNFEAAPVRPEDPIAVSWQDGAAIAELTSEVAGLGGSRIMTTPYGGRRYVAGTIALSRDFYAQLEARGDHAEALAVLLHEFGHVLGLAHVDSPGELMNEENVGRTTFGPGDLEGLRRLGQGPC